MKVSAVVVSHGHARELERSLPALAPQVDELVVIANLPGSVGALPAGARVLENPRPRTFAANVNARRRGDGRRVRSCLEPGRGPRAGRGRGTRRLRGRHPRAGLVGPLVFWPDGTLAAVAAPLPDGARDVWRRTPLRLLRDPYEHQRLALRHAARTSRCRATGCSAAPAC